MTRNTPEGLAEIGARHFRSAEIIPLDTPAQEDGAAEVEISFSSETPYARVGFDKAGKPYRYLEVLGHAESEIDLEFLRARAPVLKDHINLIDHQVGTVTRAWVEGGKGRAVFRFHDTPDARALQKRVLSGDVTNVSVGYEIPPGGARSDGESDGLPVIRATRWVPREVSFVAAPADPSVGFGRSADDTLQTIPLSPVSEVPVMSDGTNTRTAETPNPAAAAAPIPAPEPVDTAALTADVQKVERARIADITAMAAHHKVDREKTDKAIRSGMTAGDFGQEILRDMASPEATRARESQAEIGLTAKEAQSFSLVKLLRAVADPHDQAAQQAAGFELEACRAGAKAKGSTRSDLSIPADVLATWGRRDASPAAMNTTTAPTGGALVPTEYAGNMFIDGLANRSSIMRAGISQISGIVGDLDIPKELVGGTAYWVPEMGAGSAPAESTPNFGTISLARHGLAIAIPYTRAMRLQANPSIEARAQRIAIRDFALKLDKTMLSGDASVNAPNGIADYITPTTWATPSTPTWAEVVAMQSEIEDANADLGSMSFIARGSLYHLMRQIPLDGGSGLFLAAQNEIDGVPVIKSNQADPAQLFLGVWEQALLAFWSGMDVVLDTTTHAATNGHVVRLFQDVDLQIMHEEAFKIKQNA